MCRLFVPAVLAMALVSCNRIDPQSPEGRFVELFVPQLHAQFDGKPISNRQQYAVGAVKKIVKTDDGYVLHIPADNPRVAKYSYTWFITMNYDGTAWSLIDGNMASYNKKSGVTKRSRLEGSATGAAVWNRIKAAFVAASAQWSP